MPAGRPTLYTEELATLICDRVASNACGLKKLCDKYDDLPDRDTINLWRSKYPEFSAQYAQAKLKQADLLADECLDIADESGRDTIVGEDGFETCNTEWINRCRLRIDTRKWLAAKLLPKQYGKAAEEVPKDKGNGESLVEKLLSKLTE